MRKTLLSTKLRSRLAGVIDAHLKHRLARCKQVGHVKGKRLVGTLVRAEQVLPKIDRTAIVHPIKVKDAPLALRKLGDAQSAAVPQELVWCQLLSHAREPRLGRERHANLSLHLLGSPSGSPCNCCFFAGNKRILPPAVQHPNAPSRKLGARVLGKRHRFKL